MTTTVSNGKAATIKNTFSRETAVSIDIQADKSIIWALLTNANDFPRWNSTVISIEGTIAQGEKIKLKAKLDPKREFKLKVKEFEADNRLVWGDAMGNRVYTLKSIGNNLTMIGKCRRSCLIGRNLTINGDNFTRFAIAPTLGFDCPFGNHLWSIGADLNYLFVAVFHKNLFRRWNRLKNIQHDPPTALDQLPDLHRVATLDDRTVNGFRISC